MTPYIMLFCGILLLSATLSYAWWVRFRVWILRQDLFEIRDRLWDEAQKYAFVSDSHYRDLRETINASIRIAPRLSFPVWLKVVQISDHLPRQVSSIPQVESARMEAALRVHRYIFRQTASGFFAWVYASLLHRTAESRVGEKEVQSLFESDGIERIDRQLEQFDPFGHRQDLIGA